MGAFPFRSWELLWYIMILIIGCVGNIIVLIVILKSKKVLRSSSFNVYVFALGLSDLLISIIGVPNYVLSTGVYEHPTGVPGDNMCRFFTGYLFPFWLLDVSAFLLVLITLDRKKAIINPLSALTKQRLRKSLFIVLSVFIFALFVQIPTMVGLQYDTKNPEVGRNCSYKYSWLQSILIYVVVFTFEVLLPFTIMIISFYQVKKVLLKTDDALKASLYCYQGDQTVFKKKKSIILKRKLKTIETMKLVVLAYFVCILPNNVLYIVFQFAHVKSLAWNSVPYQVAVLLRFSNSCVNPLLYSFSSQQFRNNFYEVFKCFCAGYRLKKKLTLSSKRLDGYQRVVNDDSSRSDSKPAF